ncbi:MAG: UDP-glucose 4-epimerase GalE [Actinobacteria bacterium]|nr:UDP-glucose 4-epimerase GalE [Actinomycetota bacterium]
MILVTGGAGYIGSHTVRTLQAGNEQVVVLDSLEFGHRSALLGAELIVGNIRDRALVTELCRSHKVTQVVHFAAYKAVGESMEQPDRYWLNNVAGTVDLVEGVLAAGVKQFVFSSSCSVNGTPAELPLTEKAPIAPESVYAETKAMVERILGWYGVTHGLRSVSLRYFNAAGASTDGVIGEDWGRAQNLVPLVMKATLGKRPPLEVFGTDYPTPDGTCIRDYIHVDDLAEAHCRALAYLTEGGATIALNVGTGVGTSVLEIIKATERISGRTVPYTVAPRRAGDPVASYADPTMSHKTLGWAATRTVDDIIGSAWQWHSTHPDGFPD